MRRRRWAIGAAVVAATAALALPPGVLLAMPGKSHEGPLPPLTPDEDAIAEVGSHLVTLAFLPPDRPDVGSAGVSLDVIGG